MFSSRLVDGHQATASLFRRARRTLDSSIKRRLNKNSVSERKTSSKSTLHNDIGIASELSPHGKREKEDSLQYDRLYYRLRKGHSTGP